MNRTHGSFSGRDRANFSPGQDMPVSILPRVLLGHGKKALTEGEDSASRRWGGRPWPRRQPLLGSLM